jgi:hypothetical protein
MNPESFTGAIRHIWGFLVPPLLNLIILVSILGTGLINHSCVGNESVWALRVETG